MNEEQVRELIRKAEAARDKILTDVNPQLAYWQGRIEALQELLKAEEPQPAEGAGEGAT